MSFPRYSVYKDSGLSWLAEVPAHWVVTKTKHVVQFTTGWTPPTGDAASFEGDNPWANISDLGPKYIFDASKRISDDAIRTSRIKVSPKGSLLFSFKLSIGQVSFAGKDMFTNEAIATFLPSDAISLGFAYYAFPLFLVQNATENIYGAKLLNQELIRSAAFALPSLAEQTQIAAFLDQETAKIDELVAEQQRLLDLLKEKRQAVISHAVTKGLNPDAPTKPSGIEWPELVPTHWEVLPLTRVVRQFVDYRGVTPTKLDEGDVPLITASQIKGGRIDHSLDPVFISRREYKERMTRGYPERGDVLLTTEAPLGETAQIEDEQVSTGQRIILMKPDPKKMTKSFLFMHFRSQFAQNELLKRASGSTASGIRADRLRASPVLVPPLAEQEKIVRHIGQEISDLPMIEEMAQRQVDLLNERRAALISAAVTGKIDVRELPNRKVA